MKKIVINRCYGGFGLSQTVLEKLALIKNQPDIHQEDIPRDDPDLVSIVNDLGEESWTTYSELKIVEIPDDVDWIIEEYDGMEWIAERHRTWR